MKDNKSPRVDGIPPKLLKESVQKMSTPLAKVNNLSLEDGIVPSEWKEANIMPLFKKGSRNEYQGVVCFTLSPTSIAVAGFASTVCKLQSRFTNTPRIRIR